MATPIELLAPARNIDIAIDAINNGADAVYIGASKFGARALAGNSIEDIARLTAYAHQFNAKVYVTINTVILDSEIKEVEQLIHKLYEIHVDALIVQDMAILRMNLPPIALHASTQCDIRTPEKAKFLASVGFSQIVLARELTITEIRNIHDAAGVPIECFVHGALCVSYSGKCHVSQAVLGRSANRGECAQLCRLPYNLIDGKGQTVCEAKHLLSLRDLNQSDYLMQMLDAGVSSFKIEGRLKDGEYVKNIVAHYRHLLDDIIEANPNKFVRASVGTSATTFSPTPAKSFNRGFSNYFLNERYPDNGKRMASLSTPKSLGEPIGKVISAKGKSIKIDTTAHLANGDGISFFNAKGEYAGFRVNYVSGNVVETLQPVSIAPKTQLYRTYDKAFEDTLNASKTVRTVKVNFALTDDGSKILLKAKDERGNSATKIVTTDIQQASKPQSEAQQRVLQKLGGTIYSAGEIHTLNDIFIPASVLTEARRNILVQLDEMQLKNYSTPKRAAENSEIQFPSDTLTYADNVANKLAQSFYAEHGVTSIEPALESSGKTPNGTIVMRTRYCLRRELGYCKKTPQGKVLTEPLTLTPVNGNFSLELTFDCANCEMNLRIKH